MLRFVAFCHFVWALVLLAVAAWFGGSALSVLPHMSTGTSLTTLLAVLTVTASMAAPPAALGIWMAVLGRMTWARSPDVRAPLLWTHGALLVAGLLACVSGAIAMEAAARSAERGGGLLGPIALLPLLGGIPIVLLAILSIGAALSFRPIRPAPGGLSSTNQYRSNLPRNHENTKKTK